MQCCDEFPKTTKVESLRGTDDDIPEANIDWPNSCTSAIVIMFKLASNTRPYICLAVHKCACFTHKTKSSHETTVNRIYRYLQNTKKML